MSTDEIEKLITHINTKPHDLSNKFELKIDLSQPPIWTPEVSDNKPSDDETKKELIRIIMWVLGCKEVSAKQLMKRFKMGNRAYEIIEKLSKMRLVEVLVRNQPRAVIPQIIEDIPTEIMELLLNGGISKDDIVGEIQNRS